MNKIENSRKFWPQNDLKVLSFSLIAAGQSSSSHSIEKCQKIIKTFTPHSSCQSPLFPLRHDKRVKRTEDICRDCFTSQYSTTGYILIIKRSKDNDEEKKGWKKIQFSLFFETFPKALWMTSLFRVWRWHFYQLFLLRKSKKRRRRRTRSKLQSFVKRDFFDF